MATATYMLGRKKYSRPQAILFADNPGTTSIVNGGTPNAEFYYVPDGYETLAQQPDGGADNKFLILSDDNRGALDFQVQRIEKRERMISGRMRSYHIADKLSLSVSWNMLPSRSAITFPGFNDLNGAPDSSIARKDFYTTDGGAGGVELLDWYQSFTQSFWVYLSYDKYNSYGTVSSGSSNPDIYLNLPKYNQVVEMFFSNFSYSVVKRGGSNHDFWNINLSLEEV
jgi:hypothetical protein